MASSPNDSRRDARVRARPLRLKLTLWFLLVFTILQVTIVGGVVLFRRESIRRSRDDALARSAEKMVDNLLLGAPWSAEWVAENVPSNARFLLYAIRDAAGEVLVASSDVASELPFTAWESVPAGTIGAVFRTVGPQLGVVLPGEARDLRAITVPFRIGDDLFYFQAAVEDDVVERLFGPFQDLVLIGVPVGVFAAMVAAWVIAGRAVSPIQRLSEAARRVSPGNLTARFRVPTSDEEISRLENELNAGLARLEAGYEAQNQFLDNVSHELRTPISVLLTEAQVSKMGERVLDKSYGFIDKAERELQRLSRLVESILLLARAETFEGRELDRISVNDLVLESVQRCRLLADQRDVHLVPNLVASVDGDPDPVVTGDDGLLQAMVDNLVRNAIAHSPKGASIGIDARVSGAEVEVVVRDRGPGIAVEYLDKVFDRFVQEPKDGERGGTGLGLAIASSVAERHRGSIAAQNLDQGGCAFVVRLPLAENGGPE